MNELFEWPIVITITANLLGALGGAVLLVLFLWVREFKAVLIVLGILMVFALSISLTANFPGRWWSLAIGSLTSILALILLIGSAYSLFTEADHPSTNDKAVVDDFRNWATGGDLGQKKEVSGFGAYASRDKEMHRDTGVSSSEKDPVCSNCGTVYNREVVISLIKQQSPEIFDFQTWTTKFVCKQCREEIVISGTNA